MANLRFVPKMPRSIKPLSILLFVGFMLLITSCLNRTINDASKSTSDLDVLNSALNFCEENEGIIILNTIDDSEVNYCMLNGKECDVGALMKNKCSQIKVCELAKNWDAVACTRDYVPVCATDGNTYSNGCTACMARVKMYTNGACLEHFCTRKELENNVCTLQYAPVCGNDNVTYANKCSACASGAMSWKIGEC